MSNSVVPGSAKFTYGHLLVLIGAIAGIGSAIYLFLRSRKAKQARSGIYS